MKLQSPGQGNAGLILSLTMLLIYLGLGFFFIVSNEWINIYPRPNRTYIGLVFIAWAAFRGFMAWQKYKRSKHENDEDE